MKIPESLIREVRERTDLVALVGEQVPLRRAGDNHLGLCPFHAEKSPSFNVSARKQFYYCFGCQATGDAIHFLQERDGCSFVAAVQDLARRAGIELPEETPALREQRQKEETERQRLVRLMDLACAWYESQLARWPRAAAYLAQRGIGEEVRRRFRLGYAPDDWDGLLGFLATRRAPGPLAELAGLLVRREEAAQVPTGPATPASHYDRFRARILFPLLTPAGEVVAFGGRVLPDAEGAKYINSPETPLYKKGDHLYGLHAAREAIRKERRVILVEGNFDVLSLHQHGLPSTVAPMGTALTEAQIRVLQRLLGPEGHVLLMLDGDRAGRSATKKDIALFTSAAVQVRVARLPDGEDPDTYVVRDRAGFDERCDAARPALDHLLEEAVRKAQHDTVAGKAHVLQEVVPLLQAVREPPLLDMYVAKLAGGLAVQDAVVWGYLRGAGPRSPTDAAEFSGLASRCPATLVAGGVEHRLLALCADHPELLQAVPEDVLGLLDLSVAELLREARDLARTEVLTAARLVELAPTELRPAVVAAALDNPSEVFQQAVRSLRAAALAQQLTAVTAALREAEEAKDQVRVADLMSQGTQLLAQRRDVLRST